jgi:hypothetical protein
MDIKQWLESQVRVANGTVSSELLGGNVVKENFARGQVSAFTAVLCALENMESKTDTPTNTSHGAEPSEIISLCVGCIKENCPERSEISCCPVTVCAMRQAK